MKRGIAFKLTLAILVTLLISFVGMTGLVLKAVQNNNDDLNSAVFSG